MAPDSEHEDPKAQMNVRIPRSLIRAVDERRGQLGMTRDSWIANAIELALRTPLGTSVRKTNRPPDVARGADRHVNGLG